MEKEQSIQLFYQNPAANSDKEYNVFLKKEDNGWTVEFSYGKRGNPGSVQTKTPYPVSFDSASRIYDDLVNSKTTKGYHT